MALIDYDKTIVLMNKLTFEVAAVRTVVIAFVIILQVVHEFTNTSCGDVVDVIFHLVRSILVEYLDGVNPC